MYCSRKPVCCFKANMLGSRCSVMTMTGRVVLGCKQYSVLFQTKSMYFVRLVACNSHRHGSSKASSDRNSKTCYSSSSPSAKNDDDTETLIHTPGLLFESFDRDGNPQMTSLMVYVTSARRFATQKNLERERTMYDWTKLTSDRLTFVASTQITTEKEMYDRSVPKNPLDVKYSLGHVGTSSISTVGSVIVPSTGQTILRNIHHFVGIDKKSRRPIPLPDWWKQKYGELATLKNPLIIPKMETPLKAVPYTAKVAWSHTDNNNHANFRSYVHFCINALHYAIENGSVKRVTKDVVKCGIKSMRNKYIGESLENDELTVQVWESDTEDRTVQFDVQKCGNSIFQSRFVYH